MTLPFPVFSEFGGVMAAVGNGARLLARAFGDGCGASRGSGPSRARVEFGIGGVVGLWRAVGLNDIGLGEEAPLENICNSGGGVIGV
ncbi:hypothetical protein VTH06DRAFT_8058 [Thermothelomyces fergusii]